MQTEKTQRTLGRSDIEVSALGLGCWAIGGRFSREGNAAGWGEVDDNQSAAGIRRGLELGVTFFDTADVYGTGHSEIVLGEALGADRENVTVATKFGNTFDEGSGRITGADASPAYIRRACEASLRRLQTDRIDLYQLHIGNLERSQAEAAAATLEELCDEGLIRAYGWSTDDVERVGWWAGGDHFSTVQHHFNVLEDAPEMVALCEREGLASINRGPLAMGLLSGKFDSESKLPDDDVRGSGAPWLTAFDAEGRPQPEFLDALVAIRDVLCSDRRTLVQGALGWIWARSERTIPIPGFRSVDQVTENAGALEHGPLPPEALEEIDALLGRAPTASMDS